MKKMFILIVAMMSIVLANAEEIEDPYKKIEYFVLENGLQVYLLSNEKATNTNISMHINVGWDIENNDNFGLSHLVEHMVFRDERVPYRDYLDYMKEEGASYVNGFTSRYETELLTTIDSNKSYWIAKLFAQMIFDKRVNEEDIETEKGAVQVEIGEKVWYDKIVSRLAKLKNIFPENETIYETHFGLSKAKDLPDYYVEKVNNKNFTLSEVMDHYNTYYYPSNMILKISGNFDTQKMKSLVLDTYSPFSKTGTKRTVKPKRDATLSHKKYAYHREGVGKNYGYLGTQYLFDDCEKHIILNAFVKYVATKVQQKLRNEDGKSYTVSKYALQSRGAGVVAVSFDGLHDDFDNNIKTVKDNIDYYVENIDDSMIEDALNEYKKKYTSVEFDSNSLSSLVDKAEHMRTEHQIEDKTHYEFFKGITPQRFKDVIKETFVAQNEYKVLYRDYYWFTGDVAIFGTLIWVFIVYLFFTYSHWLLAYRKIKYTKREVLFSHRISNRLMGLIVFLTLYFSSALFYVWLQHLLMKYMMGDANYLFTLALPYSIYASLVSMVIYVSLFFFIYRFIVRYHSRIDATGECLYILGSNPIVVNKSSVKSLEVVPWKLGMFFKIKGWAFFFWRPLLQVQTKTETYYVRSSNAEQLRVDLVQRWMYR